MVSRGGELHRYREAVSRMGRDILTLTEEVRVLYAENETLRGERGMSGRGGMIVDGDEEIVRYGNADNNTFVYNQRHNSISIKCDSSGP